ncbi:hypothetical protein F4779DRAFT_637101 [Xylariaceae sp. FL0662B]|nr:hypothetical protein F4779DRAFT_637101 [Xylariaceae sp. FL0662B]
MDWPSSSDPFVHSEDFDCDQQWNPESGSCRVIQNYRSDTEGQELVNNPISLEHEGGWEDWFKTPVFLERGMANPQKGFVILFIPRAADTDFPGGGSQVADYTDLPIPEEYWEKVVQAFQLPRHFVKAATRRLTSIISICRTHNSEKLWMHTAVMNPEDKDPSAPEDRHEPALARKHPFALAATHFEARNLTLAVMIGCTNSQIEMVTNLAGNWEDAISHPLLMLGLCAELQLDRLDTMVKDQTRANESLTSKINGEGSGSGRHEFGWGLIHSVQSTRENNKKVEGEVDTTRNQLSKAVDKGVGMVLGKLTETENGKNNIGPSGDRNNADDPGVSESNGNTSPDPGIATEVTEENIEITNLFSERFNDILARLDRLGATCRANVDGISFTTEIIRNELARREAKASVDTTKFGTAISFVAMVYLPMTAMATIFAMPIFQWTNDWRDWRYQPVASGNASSSTSDTNTDDSPVVSGYIWIYIGIAAGLTIVTFVSFFLYISKEIYNNPSKPQAQASPLLVLLSNVRGLADQLSNLVTVLMRRFLSTESDSRSSKKTSSTAPRSDSQDGANENIGENRQSNPNLVEDSRRIDSTNLGSIDWEDDGATHTTRQQLAARSSYQPAGRAGILSNRSRSTTTIDRISPTNLTHQTAVPTQTQHLPSRQNTSQEHYPTESYPMQALKPYRSLGDFPASQISSPGQGSLSPLREDALERSASLPSQLGYSTHV